MAPRRGRGANIPDDEPEESAPEKKEREWVVTVGGQPVFSTPDHETAKAKKQAILQEKIRLNESLELPEHQVKIGQVKFAHKDDRTGTFEEEGAEESSEETEEKEEE